MCGIVALYSPERPIDPGILERATATLAHRGPDGRGHWLSAGRDVGLGHCWLALLDLTATAGQPMADAAGGVHVVVNGEFYDFERIRDELQREGHRFHTRSDSEILLPLYRRHGVAALARLRGEFAFVLWDAPNRRLFAARDRFGIKPLFYARIGRQLFLASEIKALLAAGVPAEWDGEVVHQLHSIWAHPPGRTLFRNVFQVPPGHYLLATDESCELVRYWDFDFPRETAPEETLPVAEQVARVREKLHEAVRLRLRADVPVGCYLSGGIDSCAALGIAARYSRVPPHAFTLSFDDPAYDEIRVAEEMARHAGAPFHPIEVRSADFAAHFDRALQSGETLIYNASVVAKHLLSRHVRDAGHKVVLTGEGADEVFAGYAPFRQDLLRHRHAPDDPELARQLAALHAKNRISLGSLPTGAPHPALASLRAALGSVPAFLEAPAHYLDAGRKFFHPEFRERFRDRDVFGDFIRAFDVAGQLAGRHPVNQSLYLWSRSLLPNYLLSQLGDRMEMAHSVEGRLPFLDHELVELVTRLPVSVKIKDGTEKYLLREAVRDVVTDTVYRRQKHPFMAPPAAGTMESPFFRLVNETLRDGALKEVPFYDADEIRRLLDLLPTMDALTRQRVDPLLMTFLSVTRLQTIFRIGG